MKIVINDKPVAFKQRWKPKTKKRRIQNKWNKRDKKPSNFISIFQKEPLMWPAQGIIICTSAQVEAIRRMSNIQALPEAGRNQAPTL